MRTRILFAAALMALASPALAEEFKLVVNASNPVESLSKDEAAELFLKKVTRWSSGQVVHVVEPAEVSVRNAFYRSVAGKSPSAVKAYWNQLIFSGREVPPVSKTSDADVIAFVRSNPGALGYVSAGTEARGVKAIALKD
jgi:ABC-type phosphate transport system substrate-binding protein